MSPKFYKQLSKKYPINLLNTVQYNASKYPIYSFSLGNKINPVFRIMVTAGYHGNEKIGVDILLEFLTMAKNYDLSSVNIVGIPVVNPYGYIHNTRYNGDRIDLMRNAPIDEPNASFFIGGQRFSKFLPNYRGKIIKGLAYENEVILDFVNKYQKNSIPLFHIDIHSGFGNKTLIWPAQNTKKNRNKEMFKLLNDLCSAPQFHYEEQAYLCNGDMLEYLFKKSPNKKSYLAATMEIGFWKQLKKSPWLSFKMDNWFNPVASEHPSVVQIHANFLDNLYKELVIKYSK